MFVYDKKNDKKYDLKNGFKGDDGKNYIIYSFGDGDYFYLKERSDEKGVELNPIVGILKLTK